MSPGVTKIWGVDETEMEAELKRCLFPTNNSKEQMRLAAKHIAQKFRVDIDIDAFVRFLQQREADLAYQGFKETFVNQYGRHLADHNVEMVAYCFSLWHPSPRALDVRHLLMLCTEYDIDVSLKGLERTVKSAKTKYSQPAKSFDGGGVTLLHIDRMTGMEFQEFLGTLFENMGYSLERNRASADQGGDLIMRHQGQKVVVQAKRWAGNVGNSAVQEALGARAYYRCQRAIVVTNAYYTRSAANLAKAAGVELWDRDKLVELLESIR